jgi:hypothetical protein
MALEGDPCFTAQATMVATPKYAKPRHDKIGRDRINSS